MRQHPCPICGRPVDPNSSLAMPFCSLRCRQIDLARWLGEHYRVPGPMQEPETEESPAEPSSATHPDAPQEHPKEEESFRQKT